VCGGVLQVTLFIGGVMDTEEEVAHLLSPFGPVLRTFIVTNPAVSCHLHRGPACGVADTQPQHHIRVPT
jgi:hypothetical protein